MSLPTQTQPDGLSSHESRLPALFREPLVLKRDSREHDHRTHDEVAARLVSRLVDGDVIVRNVKQGV